MRMTKITRKYQVTRGQIKELEICRSVGYFFFFMVYINCFFCKSFFLQYTLKTKGAKKNFFMGDDTEEPLLV